MLFSAFCKICSSTEWNRKKNLNNKMHGRVTTACLLLRALERITHEEMWTANFESAFRYKNKKAKKDR